MSILITIVSLILLFLIGILIVLILFLKKDELKIKEQTPKVSILIAARNEEENIVSCLKAIANLKYSNYEVWIGNDYSTDRTEEVIKEYIEEKPNFHLLNIESNLGKAKGKSNVLAQLAHKAQGAYFFITDADIQVPENWVQSMLASFNENTGIVSGFTVTKGKSFFAKMQQIDWTYAMGMVKVVSDLGQPLVGIGNNMAITKEAYFSTGGYENLPFSIVEDYQLFKEITKKGYGYKNLLTPEITATSKPIDNFWELLQQRKRWMVGAIQLPLSILIILILQAAYYTIAVVLCFIKPQIAINLIGLKVFFQIIFIKSLCAKIGERVSLFHLLFFELYQMVLSTFTLIYYILPQKVQWKGRTY